MYEIGLFIQIVSLVTASFSIAILSPNWIGTTVGIALCISLSISTILLSEDSIEEIIDRVVIIYVYLLNNHKVYIRLRKMIRNNIQNNLNYPRSVIYLETLQNPYQLTRSSLKVKIMKIMWEQERLKLIEEILMDTITSNKG